MKITIETIPYEKMRIPGQIGDWQWQSGGGLLIQVSEMPDWRYEAAVAVHELVEVLLCNHDGVSEADVDAFDMAYENDRPPFGMPGADSEAGDDRNAPYARQHCFATAVERMMIAAFGLSWADYEQAIEALP